MANIKSLVISSGTIQQIANADTLLVGSGITTSAGNLTISSAGGATTVSDAASFSSTLAVTGASTLTGNVSAGGTLDVTGAASLSSTLAVTGASTLTGNVSTGGTLTVTGVSTFNGASTFNANATIGAGATLATSGSGNINLPNNGSARFQVEGTTVSANVTATNLGTLTGGGNADALHSHANVATTFSSTAGETLVSGNPVVINDASGIAKVYKADADGSGVIRNVVGFAAAAADADAVASVAIDGERSMADAVWDAVPAVTDVGKVVYLSETVGKVTITAPSTAGSNVQKVGIVSVGGTGAVKMIVQIGNAVTL